MSGEGMSAADNLVGADAPVVVVHIGIGGDVNYLMAGPVDFFVVDERSPHDRVYQMTHEATRDGIAAVLGEDAIGSRHDARHPAIAARIIAAAEGASHLREVQP